MRKSYKNLQVSLSMTNSYSESSCHSNILNFHGLLGLVSHAIRAQLEIFSIVLWVKPIIITWWSHFNLWKNGFDLMYTHESIQSIQAQLMKFAVSFRPCLRIDFKIFWQWQLFFDLIKFLLGFKPYKPHACYFYDVLSSHMWVRDIE